MDGDQPPSSWTVAAGDSHESSSPTGFVEMESMYFGDDPESPTAHKRTHSEMAVLGNTSKLPPTPQTPEESIQSTRLRLRENEKPAARTRVMGPPAPPRDKNLDQNGLPPSAQKEAETPDGSPLPRSNKVNTATQRKRESATKLRKEHEIPREGDQSEDTGTSDHQKELRSTLVNDGAQQQHDAEAAEDQDEHSEDGEEEDDDAGEVDDEDEGDLPELPMKPFGWAALQTRLGAELADKKREEDQLWEEFTTLVNYYGSWCGASMNHETDRAFKRHKTQQYYVRVREAELEDRRQHYQKVTAAFQAALSMLN